MLGMANQSYMSVWCRDFPEDQILERLEGFLRAIPISAQRPGFTSLVIRAVDTTEQPILEQDLRGTPLDAAGIVELSREHLHDDCAYEVRSAWDLWEFDAEAGKPKLTPHALEIYCHGENFDSEFWRDNGHFQVNLGFEHLFTGHAGLLGFRQLEKSLPQSAEERRFLEAMAWPENFQAYQEKTRANIGQLLDWTRKVERALPVDRIRLWSEGEDNFEARLEEILATR